jgi:TonB family protein
VIDLGKNKLKKVFESGLKRNHSLSGEIKIKLTVLSSGKVDKVYILNSSTNNAEFDEAIVNNITKWTFDKVDSSFPLIEIIVPLKFECK